MAVDRPLRNLTRDHLLGIYSDIQGEPSGKKYNLRKELQTDKRENVVHANRWVTRDQYLELARLEILARGLELPEASEPDAASDKPAAAPTTEEEADDKPSDKVERVGAPE